MKGEASSYTSDILLRLGSLSGLWLWHWKDSLMAWNAVNVISKNTLVSVHKEEVLWSKQRWKEFLSFELSLETASNVNYCPSCTLSHCPWSCRGSTSSWPPWSPRSWDLRDTLSAGRMTIEGSKGQVRNVAIPLLGTHNVGNSLI